jgi:hypothetical protein
VTGSLSVFRIASTRLHLHRGRMLRHHTRLKIQRTTAPNFAAMQR